MIRKSWVLVGVFLLVIMGTACGSKDLSLNQGKKDEQQEKPQVTTKEPFTGEPLVEENRPAVMVMINNHRAARPQTGLSKADMVIEALAEGEITRFAAFYHSNMEGTVGPVRSVRPYFLDMAKGSHAVVAHAGGSKAALQEINDEKLPSLDGIHKEARRFYRVHFRKAPHNLYTDLQKLHEGANAITNITKNPIVSPYHFNRNGAMEKGQVAKEVHLSYHRLYKASYRYDEESGRYIRYSQGIEQKDRETKEPLTMENVWVIKAPQRVIDSAGHRRIDWDQGGNGMLFQKGKGISIAWKEEDGWIIPLMDGKVAPLIPGKSWINIIPENEKVTWR
ncbi:DUF3048 domain-containing protein [Marininema halotolerans]|uniref:DUF3048 domain-containing protein n=1 Tax=Marininema halotolerans TaxID=1155944 RepID=A0A1I6SFD9_9BACL|nr:DUF3048 domain-containing protein [Marininema halotolerans]SFS75682.1 Protein of unknown function [Marininema halotolerans]